MSAELSRREFELLLDEYVRGELPAHLADACEQFIAGHPEARNEADAVAALLLSPAWQAAGNPSARRLERVMARTSAGLQDPTRSRRRSWISARPWRPALVWTALAAAVAVGGVLLWPSAAPVAFADVVARLQQVGSLQVVGWVRGEGGQQVPYRQLLLADGTFRAEVGVPGHERVVVWRDGVRRVRDHDGRVYRTVDGRRPREIPTTLRNVLENLQALYRDAESVSGSYSFTQEQVGGLTRFTRRDRGPLGRAASRREWSLDVDGASDLPVASRVREMVGDEWFPMSELRFTAFDEAPPAGTFDLAGPDLPLDEAACERLWFELGISAASIQVPAVMPPAGDAEVQLLGPGDLPEGINGGGYRSFDGGVSVVELHDMALSSAVVMVSNLAVSRDPVANRRVSLRLRSKTALPWRRQLAPVLAHLGIHAEVAKREVERQRYEFRLTGSAPEPSREAFPSERTVADVDGYRYRFRKMPLREAIATMRRNSSPVGYQPDTLVFSARAPGDDTAFATEVDFEFHNPDGTWKTNRDFLRRKFGVEVEVRAETVTVTEITLRDAE